MNITKLVSVLKLQFLFLCISFLVIPIELNANYWTSNLEEAAKAVANGSANEAQRVFVYNHNKELNKMALHNQQFEQNVYQKCQNDFFRRHTKNIEDAARKAGVKATVKPPSKINPKTGDYVFNPGTDTDVDIVPLNPNQKLDLKKIREVEDNFQDIVRTQSTNAKVTPPKGKIDTDTDFLPNPHHTTDADFAEITRHINNNGGTAYTSRESALAQSKLSSNQPIDLDEASKFSQEMDKLAQKKFDYSSDLRKQANTVRQSDPARAKQLDLEADLSDFQGSKYLERQHQLNNKLRQQHGLEPKPRDITGLDEAMDTIKDAGRGVGTRIDAVKVKALKDQAMQKSTEDLIETLSDIAKVDPSKATKATEAIAKKLSTLPPSKQGSMIAELERTMGSEATKKIVQQTKGFNQTNKAAKAAEHADDIKAPKGMSKLKVVVTVGGALLIGKTGYDISIANIKPDDTLMDWFANMYKNSLWYGTGIGTAYEQAEAEELERYHKEFSGEQDPSLVKHITVTLLKTGTYMGRDAIIGLIYLPDAIAQALSWSWGEVTGTNKINAYTEAQNQLANAMKKVILEKRAFNDAMNMVKKMGLHAEDAKPFLDCLCRGCGGSLGGFFNPACTSDIGHGPCQCNGPLTIWKTPVPSGKEAQYNCFNEVARMRYNEAQAIFDAWRQRALEENAKSVEKELQEIKESYTEALKNKELARQKSDEIAAIKDLLLERDLDGVKALYGPCLQNHAERNVEKGQMDCAIDNVDGTLNKVGMRDFQNESNAKQRKSQFEKWKESWGKAKKEQFRQIDGNLSKNNVQMARGLLERLEYDMVKNPLRPLPHAFQDPDFIALKERVSGGLSHYEEARKEAWAEATKFEKVRDRRNAVPILENFLKAWEHSIEHEYDLKRQIGYDLSEVARADVLCKNGEQFEKNRDYADAIHAYKQSLAIQIDPKLEVKIVQLTGAIEQKKYDEALKKKEQQKEAEKLLKQGQQEWQEGKLEKAISTLQEATQKDSSNKQIAKTLKAMQSQKKMIDSKRQISL